ncbi:MAG: hypothetical protein N2442_02535 [Spirochaetes bacterium]|nr:hypothetical protein [Spirochaetota bacterium]
MCPKEELLSVYIDEELSKEAMEAGTAHLEEWPQCMAIVSRYRRVQGKLKKDLPMEWDVESIQQRMAIELERYRRTTHPFWHKKVRIGWVAVAASFAFILGGTLSYTLLRPKDPDLASFLASHKSLNVTINVKNMKQLLDILNHQQGIREITIQLPENPQFEFRSEPVFIRASEFNRSTFR